MLSSLEENSKKIIELYSLNNSCPQIVFTLQLPITARSLQRFLKARGVIRTKSEALKLCEERRIATILGKWANYKKTYKRKVLSPIRRYEVLKRDNFACKLCGGSASSGVWLEVDHIKEIHEGGTNDISNLQTLCKECNMGKYRYSVDNPQNVIN